MTNEKKVFWFFATFIGIYLLFVLSFYAYFIWMDARVKHLPERRVSLTIPDTTATLSVFTRYNHAFQAEYKRRITLEETGQQTISKPIDDDTGGRNILDLYAVPQDNSMQLLLVDGWLGSTTESMHTMLHDPDFRHESRIYLNTTVTAQTDRASTGVIKLGRFDAAKMVWQPNQ